MTREGIYLNNLTVLVPLELTDTGTNHFCTYKGCDAADHVDRAGTCEIMEAQLSQPAAAPDPVCFDGVDQSGNDGGIYTVAEELGPLCHGTGYDGCRGCTEHKVEYEVRPVEILICRKDIESRLSDEPYQVLSQEKTETDQDKYNTTDTEVHQVFHQDVAGVFGPGKSGLNHGKSCLHPEYQCCTDQKPYSKQFSV